MKIFKNENEEYHTHTKIRIIEKRIYGITEMNKKWIENVKCNETRHWMKNGRMSSPRNTN